MASTDGLRVSVDNLTRFVVDTLVHLDVPDDEARIVADVLVTADLRGTKSHGVARLGRYLDCIEKGLMKPRAHITVISEWPAIALLDGGKSLGHVVAYKAMERCLDMAETAGTATVTVTNSNHYGIASYYAMMAAERGMIGMSMTNTAPYAVPTNGRKIMLGTNPIAVAVPTNNGHPWVLDMATTTVAMGQIEAANRAGRPLPYGLAVDSQGEVTTDPKVVLNGGALLPLGGSLETGGHKGYGLSVLVDILSGILPGASYSAMVQPGWGHTPLGHYFTAIRIDAVRSKDDFIRMVDKMIEDFRSAPAVAGKRIVAHGDIEAETERVQRSQGILLQEQVADTLSAIAERYGVESPLTPCRS